MAEMAAIHLDHHPLGEAALRAGIDRLAAHDPDFGAALRRIGYPRPRQHRSGFATLLRIMTAQQLSTHAAAAIWRRLEAALAPEVTAAGVLALDEATARQIGFGRRKLEHARALAAALEARRLDLAALAEAPDQQAIEVISALPGFGPWSAQIYLLFALGRSDVFPAGDLALQIGIQRLRRLEARPDARLAAVLAEPWRPLRGCAAIFLWHLYGATTLETRSGDGRSRPTA